MSVTLRLGEEIDVSRGDMLVRTGEEPTAGRRFDAMLVWMSERPLDRQKSYLLKHTTQTVRAEIDRVYYTTNLETLKHEPATRLELNEIGRVTVACHRPVFYDPYAENRGTGAFILIDSLTNNTVAAGMILGAESATESRSAEKHATLERARSQVSRDERAERLAQKGCTVWLTGLPASGKTEIAYALERRLFDIRRFSLVIDPDDGLSTEPKPDGSSSPQTPELARRLTDAGLIAIFAYASPLRSDREGIRAVVGPERFVEVHVATSLASRKQRDARGVYGGHTQPSEEPPQAPDAVLTLDREDADTAANAIIEALVRRGLLPSSYAL
jgi:bifunctional enzyme CysN/CysC